MIIKFVNEETRAFRIQQCDSCDQKSSIGVCLACNCWIKAKSRFVSAKCPLHKWGEEGPPPTEEELIEIRNNSRL